MAEAFRAGGRPRRAAGARGQAAREAVVRHSLRAAIDAYQGLYDELRGVPAQEVVAAGGVVAG